MAAAALCFCLAAATAFRLPVFFGADERPHFAYAVAVTHGDLPRLDDRVPTHDDRFPILERWADGLAATGDPVRKTVFVANHPPLFYVLAAPTMWLASATGWDTLPPLTLRLLNAALMSLGVVLTGLLARDALARSPHRDTLAAVAAGLTAVTPNLVGVATYGQNDGIGLVLAAGALLVALRLWRRGPDRRLIVAAAGLAAGCALARASLAPVVVLLAATAVVGAHRHVPVGRRLRASLLAGGAIVAAPVVAAGWFYQRNRELYGTPTGDRHNLELLGRVVDHSSIVGVLTSGRFHGDLWTGLYGSVHPHLALSTPGFVVAALVLLVGAAVVVARRRSSRPLATTPWGLVGGALVAGYVAAIVVGIADHTAQGGTSHPRYLLPLVPLAGVAVAAAIGALPRWRMVALATITALAAITTVLLLRYSTLVTDRERDGQVPLPDATAASPLTWLAFALAATAFATLLRALAPTAAVVAPSRLVASVPTGAPVTLGAKAAAEKAGMTSTFE